MPMAADGPRSSRRQAAVAGGTPALRVEGVSGAPFLLMMPGGNGHGGVFRALAALLGGRYRVVAYAPRRVCAQRPG